MANETAAFTAFLTAAITIAVVMAVLVFAIGLAETHVVTTLKGSTRNVKRGSGFILLAGGTWLMGLAICADRFAQILFP